jgi:predicted flavoprotein YhiN
MPRRWREDPHLRGGRCNFTNRDLDVRAPHKHYVGQNPQFCRSALSRYTPQDFIALMERHGIPYEEKHKGQLFATTSAEDIIRMLLAECADGDVTRWQPCRVEKVVHAAAVADAESDAEGTAAIRSTRTVAWCARPGWCWPPAACPSPRSAPPISATAWPSSSAAADRAPCRPGAADL